MFDATLRPTERANARASLQGDNDASESLFGFYSTMRFGDSFHGIDSIDSRFNFAVLDHLLECEELFLRFSGKGKHRFLVCEHGCHGRSQHVGHTRICHQVTSLGGQRGHAPRVGASGHHVEDHVVSLAGFCEVFFGVVQESRPSA